MTSPIENVLRELWNDGANSTIITSDDEKLDEYENKAISHALSLIRGLIEGQRHTQENTPYWDETADEGYGDAYDEVLKLLGEGEK